MLRTARSVRGDRLGAIDGEIGHVKEFYFDDISWKIRYLVVDTGKWLPHRKVLISPHALGPVDEQERLVHVQLTREQVEKSPSIDADKPISRQFEEHYFKYYGWPFYWVDPLLMGAPPFMPYPEPSETPEAHYNPHLRSTNEMLGYHIQARDGDIGHVEDFFIDDEDWSIHDLIVDTRTLLPGKHVLVPVGLVRQISWEQTKVVADVGRDELDHLPEFHSDRHGHPVP